MKFRFVIDPELKAFVIFEVILIVFKYIVVFRIEEYSINNIQLLNEKSIFVAKNHFIHFETMLFSAILTIL
jgi:hypothetical protein